MAQLAKLTDRNPHRLRHCQRPPSLPSLANASLLPLQAPGKEAGCPVAVHHEKEDGDGRASGRDVIVFVNAAQVDADILARVRPVEVVDLRGR